MPNYIPATVNNPPQESRHIPDLLAPGSPLDSLSPDYRQEAVRWVQFHSGNPRIPGIHVDFTNDSIKRYLEFRARSSKCISQILCKIKKMGQVCGFILHTSKYQQPSLQYQVIQDAKRQVRKQRRNAGLDGEKNEALATGNFAIAMLLQAFRIRTKEDFARLHPTHQEFLAIYVISHVGCVRFGLFHFTTPQRSALLYSRLEAALMMKAKWRKTGKSNREYTLRIPCTPEDSHPGKYLVITDIGPVYISAGTIVTWYLHVSGLYNAPGSSLLFPIMAHLPNRRRHYTRWLRYVFTHALPPGSTIPKRIRPHSARAGWATDRARQNTPHMTLRAEGRWSDHRAMMQYVRECLRDLCTSNIARPIPHTDHHLSVPY